MVEIVSIDVALSSVDYLMREITYGWSFMDYLALSSLAPTGGKLTKSGMIDQLMRVDSGLSRSMLRSLPHKKLTTLYRKQFPEVTATTQNSEE